MLTLTRIRVLIKVAAIEITEPSFILWEMSWNPIQDDPDAALMKEIDEIHKIRWSAEPAGRRKVADCLVSPRAIKGMLSDRQELHVSEAGVVHVIRKERCDFAIG